MPDNMIIGVKPGMTNVVRTLTLKQTDTDPESDTYGDLVPIDLTDWTELAMIVSQENGPVIINAPCVADPDQAANKGKLTCTFDATTVAFPNLVLGEHQLEFSGKDPEGDVEIFPISVTGGRQFGTFIISETWAD
jgi:hypothetical protein